MLVRHSEGSVPAAGGLKGDYWWETFLREMVNCLSKAKLTWWYDMQMAGWSVPFHLNPTEASTAKSI